MLYGCNENTKLPDGRHCPAYALAVRHTSKWWKDKGGGGDSKSGDSKNWGGSGSSTGSNGDSSNASFGKRPDREALLVIRGTTEIGDWSINMEEEPLPFEYLHRFVFDPLFTRAIISYLPCYNCFTVVISLDKI